MKVAVLEKTATEDVLCEMWRGIFDKEEITPDDDFFALGGNSITAIKFISQVEERFGEDALLPDTLFEDGKLSILAKAIDEGGQPA